MLPDAKEPLRLVVLGDSTSFTGDRGPLLPSDPTIYPQIVRAMIEEALDRPCEVTILARAGTDSREMWRWLTKDRHVQFDVMSNADAVIVGIGSIDHAPAGVPPVLEAIVPYLRPASVRRRARTALYGFHATGARLTSSRFSRTSLREFIRLYDGILFQVRSLARGAACVAMGPTSHRSAYYGPAHPGHARREQIQLAIARRHGFPTVASWPMVEPAAGRLNPDGVHWPADVHLAVGTALARPLIAQLRGEAASPQPPAWI